MNFIVDTCMPQEWVEFLQNAGHKARYWGRIGHADEWDRVVIEHCQAIGAVLLTNDFDFGMILGYVKDGRPSVLQFHDENLDPRVIGEKALKAIEQCSSALTAGALVVASLKDGQAWVLPVALN